MNTQEARTLKPAELRQRVEDLRAEYFTLQETVRLGKERNHARLRGLRREIARGLSVLRENV